jgi:SAM-dependent methyltransferase
VHSWPTAQQLEALFDQKYAARDGDGWGPTLRKRFGYFTPDDHYEALVANLVTNGSVWADVGCGRDIFPSNRGLARTLAQRASFVLGIDPDPNIRENEFLNQAVEGLIDDYEPDREYDVVTLRMVAEHIDRPDKAAAKISSMLRKGGLAVIYTPHKWAFFSMLARATPLGAHHFFKKMLWATEERDTFPVRFRMNTRPLLADIFKSVGMNESRFSVLDDCRVFQNFYALSYAELTINKAFNALHVQYPETCILAVYEKA